VHVAEAHVEGKLRCKTSLPLVKSSSLSSSSSSTSSLRLSADGRLLAAAVRQVSAVLDTASASLLSVHHHGAGRAPADHVTRLEQQLFVAGAAKTVILSTSLDGVRSNIDGESDVMEPFVFVFVEGTLNS